MVRTNEKGACAGVKVRIWRKKRDEMALKYVRIQWLDENKKAIVTANVEVEDSQPRPCEFQREFKLRFMRRWDGGRMVRGMGAAWLIAVMERFLKETCDPDPSVGVA